MRYVFVQTWDRLPEMVAYFKANNVSLTKKQGGRDVRGLTRLVEWYSETPWLNTKYTFTSSECMYVFWWYTAVVMTNSPKITSSLNPAVATLERLFFVIVLSKWHIQSSNGKISGCINNRQKSNYIYILLLLSLILFIILCVNQLFSTSILSYLMARRNWLKLHVFKQSGYMRSLCSHHLLVFLTWLTHTIYTQSKLTFVWLKHYWS